MPDDRGRKTGPKPENRWSTQRASCRHGKEPWRSPSAVWAEGSTRPLSLVGLGAEEAVLHPAVDDVPRQHFVVRPVAEDVEAGIDAGLLHGGAPVAAVSLGRLDRRSHAPISEGEQRLIEGMSLGFDVEVDVVDVGHQAVASACSFVRPRHRLPSGATGRRCLAWARAGSRCRRYARPDRAAAHAPA